MAILKLPLDTQFNTIVMILGKEGHIQFQSFKLSEEECKIPRSFGATMPNPLAVPPLIESTVNPSDMNQISDET